MDCISNRITKKIKLQDTNPNDTCGGKLILLLFSTDRGRNVLSWTIIFQQNLKE